MDRRRSLSTAKGTSTSRTSRTTGSAASIPTGSSPRWPATGRGASPDEATIATEVPIGAADVWADANGSIYITDEGYPGIFKVDTKGILTVLAGTGEDGYSGDGGPRPKPS